MGVYVCGKLVWNIYENWSGATLKTIPVLLSAVDRILHFSQFCPSKEIILVIVLESNIVKEEQKEGKPITHKRSDPPPLQRPLVADRNTSFVWFLIKVPSISTCLYKQEFTRDAVRGGCSMLKMTWSPSNLEVTHRFSSHFLIWGRSDLTLPSARKAHFPHRMINSGTLQWNSAKTGLVVVEDLVLSTLN